MSIVRAARQRLDLLGIVALLPLTIFVYFELMWWYGERARSEAGVEFGLRSVIELPVVVGVVLVCPLVAVAAGASLVRRGTQRLLGWSLIITGPLLAFAAVLARPS